MKHRAVPVSHANCEPLPAGTRGLAEDQLHEAVRSNVPGAHLELQARVRLANRATCRRESPRGAR